MNRRQYAYVAVSVFASLAVGYLLGSKYGTPNENKPTNNATIEPGESIVFFRTRQNEVDRFEFKPYGITVNGVTTSYSPTPDNPELRWNIRLNSQVYIHATKVD